MSASDTPGTDAVLARDWKRTSYTKAGELERLARTLERESAAKDATIEGLRELLKHQSADIIEKQRTKIARLREVLEFAVEMQNSVEDALPNGYGSAKNTLAWLSEARAALNQE